MKHYTLKLVNIHITKNQRNVRNINYSVYFIKRKMPFKFY